MAGAERPGAQWETFTVPPQAMSQSEKCKKDYKIVYLRCVFVFSHWLRSYLLQECFCFIKTLLRIKGLRSSCSSSRCAPAASLLRCAHKGAPTTCHPLIPAARTAGGSGRVPRVRARGARGGSSVTPALSPKLLESMNWLWLKVISQVLEVSGIGP